MAETETQAPVEPKGRLTIQGDQAVFQLPYDLALIEAIRAIPGRVYDPRTKYWSVKLVNDRPASVRALLEHASDIAISDEDRATLDELTGDGGAEDQGAAMAFELVKPMRDGGLCASILAEWDDPDLLALVARFDHYRHPETGRVSIVLSRASAAAIAALHERRDDVLWTKPLAERVDTLLPKAGGADGEAAAGDEAGSGGDPEAGSVEAGQVGRTLQGHQISIRFTEQRSRLFISTSRPQELLKALSGAEADGDQALLTPASREVASQLAHLRHQGLDLQISPTVRQWMEDQLHWEGRLTTVGIDGKPYFRLMGEDEAHSPLLDAPPARRAGWGVWEMPMTPAGAELVTSLLEDEPRIEPDERAKRCLVALEEEPDLPVRPALLVAEEVEDGQTAFHLTVMWDDKAAKEFAALPGAMSDAPTRGRPRKGARTEDPDGIDSDASTIGDGWNAADLQEFAERNGIDIADTAAARLAMLARDREEVQRLVDLSQATDSELELAVLPGGEPMSFQVAGVQYALERRRTFIADEQGLGKTLQALLTIEHDEAYPAVVFAPASLKLNWKREISRWLPHRTSQVLSGRGSTPTGEEITVINYEIAESHITTLAALRPKALVLDESHYCKSPKAKRTKAVQALADLLPPEALRLALTGTPLVNRPKELVPQLRILGRLGEFGSGAGFERRFGSAADRERLHWHLRGTCYLRRVKREVLPQLPEKQRAVVPLTLSNQADYVKAERQFMGWLFEHFQDSEQLAERLGAAERSQALVKLGALRRLAGQGKVHTAVHWIRDFLESDEKLVVFASHREVQRGLVDAFPEAVHLLGDDSQDARDAAVQAFQNDPDVRLCICSLKVAAHGFTLTAAANVAFVELGWTPAEHDQAEDRCHRIGQEDSVTAWYLVARDTLDERMLALIEHKRAIVGAITDGKPERESSAVDAILAGYMDATAEAVSS